MLNTHRQLHMMKKIIHLCAKLKWVFLIVFILSFGYPGGYFILDSDKSHTDAPIATDDKDAVGTGVYIINLDRSKERYEYIKNYASGLEFPIERIEAVDGSTLSAEEINEKLDVKSYRTFLGYTPKRGAIGCSLSHIKAWRAFLNSPLKFAIIFEDDVSFDPHQLKIIIEDVVENSELWDIVNFDTRYYGFPLTIKKLRNNYNLSIYLTHVIHAGAYIINRKAAQNLLEKALPIKMPVDEYFTRSWELGIKFTGIENPRPVYQTFGDSNIGKSKRLPDNTFNILYFKHRICKLQSATIRFFYNLGLYFTDTSNMDNVKDA